MYWKDNILFSYLETIYYIKFNSNNYYIVKFVIKIKMFKNIRTYNIFIFLFLPIITKKIIH